MKKDKLIIIIFAVLVLAIFTVFATGIVTVSTNYSRAMDKCKELGIDCSEHPRCSLDCYDFGMEYLKWKMPRGFISPTKEECWCKINNESKQIW